MTRKIACVIALLGTLPVALSMAQAQQPGPAPTKADVQKAVKIISSDKAKQATYCKLAALDEDMANADKAGDKAKLDALVKQAEGLQSSLGPEYVKLTAGLESVDPQSAEGKALLAEFDVIDKACAK
jgi:hypothetical protein